MIRVGIVDDHQLFIDGIRSIFEQVIDIEIVLTCTSGLAYLDQYDYNLIDITITDIRIIHKAQKIICVRHPTSC